MHGGRKPEADPGFWYAREQKDRQRAANEVREAWKPMPASQAATFIEEQKRLRDNASLASVIDAAIEAQAPAPAAGGKGKNGGI